MKRSTTKRGFTLVEIMIGVSIIGLLSAIALPNLLQAGTKTRNRRFARDIKTAGHAFVQYAFDHGDYPADKTPAQMPSGMDSYLSNFAWSENTVIGGQWDWDKGVFGVYAGVSVKGPSWSNEEMLKIDAIIDDGNLESGDFRSRTGGYIYILEE